MKKVLSVIVAALTSATPAFSHEIDMKHEHPNWVQISLGIIFAISILVMMFDVSRRASKNKKRAKE